MRLSGLTLGEGGQFGTFKMGSDHKTLRMLQETFLKLRNS
jgi:hypothetical protein